MRSTRLCRLAALPFLAGACLGDVDIPPEPPVLFPVESPTFRVRQRIAGSKQAGTAVLDRGVVVVPLDDTTDWAHELELEPGDNRLQLTSRSRAGLESVDAAHATIVHEPPCPPAPTVDPPVSPTRDPSLRLTGRRAAGMAVLLGGVEVVPAGPLVE